MEPITEQGVQFILGPDNITRQQVLGPRIKLKFTHRDPAHPTLLQVSDRAFSVNCLAPYPGWQRMKAALLDAWPKFRSEAGPATITRLGVRYINKIQRRSPDETPGFWLRQTDLIPPSLLRSEPDFSFRLETRWDRINRLFATITHVSGPAMGPHGALLFDIDRIMEQDMTTDDAAVDDIAERLHEDIWNVFVEAKNGNYDRLLNGELPNETS
jgi:uncharacterized protein (TIGR04255 family)